MKNIKDTTILIVLMVVVAFSILNFVKLKRSNSLEESRKITYAKIVERNNKILALIENKKVHALNEICNVESLQKNTILYISTGQDCGGCVKNGYSILKKIESFNRSILLVTSGRNVSNDMAMFEYEYPEKFYSDPHQIVRKELNYVPTPTILLIDTNQTIVKGFILSKEMDDRIIDQIVNKATDFLHEL